MRRAVAIRSSTVMLRLATRSLGVELVELDVEAHQIAAFARDHEDIAVIRGLDQRP